MTQESEVIPTQITLHKKSRTLEVEFNSGEVFVMPCGYLRAFSKSAESKHKPQLDSKKLNDVNILAIEPVGNYAIKPIFSDGHKTGIFSWQTLWDLAIKQKENWPINKGSN